MRIYVTHCTWRKDDRLRNTGEQVTPDRLYKGKFIEAFMRECKHKGVNWAIFSDKYGVWLPHEKYEWYDKDPNHVTEDEYQELLSDFDQKLAPYDEVRFYCPPRFHRLYKRLLRETRLRDRITTIRSVTQIF